MNTPIKPNGAVHNAHKNNPRPTQSAPDWLNAITALLTEMHCAVDTKTVLTLAQNAEITQTIGKAHLGAIVANFGYQPTWRKVAWRALTQQAMPCMLRLKNGDAITLRHWQNDTLVVVEATKNGANKARTVNAATLSDAYSGELLVLEPEVETQKGSDALRFWQWLEPRTVLFACLEIFAASAVINAFQLALPLYTMNVYDKVVPNMAHETLWVLFMSVVLFFILDYIFRLLRGVVLENLSERVGEAIEMRLFHKNIGANSEHRQPVGVTTELFHEINQFRISFFGRTLVEIIEFPFFILFLLVIYAISPPIAIIPMVASITIALVHFLHHFPLRSISQTLMPLRKEREAILVQGLYGRESLRISNGIAKVSAQWHGKVRRYLAKMRASQLWNNSMSVSLPILVQMVSALVILVGAHQIFKGQLSLGGLVAATLISGRAIVPVLNFSSAMTRLSSSRHMLAHWRRELNVETDFDQNASLTSKGHITGHLLIKNLKFRYPNKEEASLNGINLAIAHGEKVGILGQSGAGKSTLLRVMSQLEKPQEGLVLLDNHAVHDMHPYALYEHISYMPQDPAFFTGSIFENIQLNTHQQNADRMKRMMAVLGFEDLLASESLSGGLSFQVGERGARLSGGQKQLVALMRAMATDADVYLLDEPTSGMDSQLEARVIRYLTEALADKTLILVTHRPSLLALVDRLLLVHQGRILDDGPKAIMMHKLFGKQSDALSISPIPLRQTTIQQG